MGRLKRALAIVGVVASLACLGWSPPANALLITTQNASTTSGTFLIDCGLCNGATPSQTLSATISFGSFVFSNGGSTLTTQVTVTNTTPVNGTTAGESITDFAFNTIPDATSVTDTSAIFNTLTEQNFPGFNTVDVCETAQNNTQNCAGGSNGGLFSGQTETFTMTFFGLNGSLDIGTDINGGTETLDVKFAGSMGSFEGSGGLIPPPCPPGTPGCVVNPPVTVPEPTSLLMLGSALIGLAGVVGLRRRGLRRRRINRQSMNLATA